MPNNEPVNEREQSSSLSETDDPGAITFKGESNRSMLLLEAGETTWLHADVHIRAGDNWQVTKARAFTSVDRENRRPKPVDRLRLILTATSTAETIEDNVDCVVLTQRDDQLARPAPASATAECWGPRLGPITAVVDPHQAIG